MNGMALIQAERIRQQTTEGYTHRHDDRHVRGELSAAAFCYREEAHAQALEPDTINAMPKPLWPWRVCDWKPSPSPVRNLIKAGALYLAEAERNDRIGYTGHAEAARVTAQKCADEIETLLAREKPTLKIRMKKHLKYLSYIVRHKWFVLLACIEHGIIWRGLIHDWSKFLPSEWFPYAEAFYGRGAQLREKKRKTGYLTPDETLELDRIQRAFDRAWLSHQHRSPHHWQHHILREDSGGTKLLRMSIAEGTEMVCDWIGTGRAITGKKGTTLDWYLRNRNNMALDYATRCMVEHMLGVPEDQRFNANGSGGSCRG